MTNGNNRTETRVPLQFIAGLAGLVGMTAIFCVTRLAGRLGHEAWMNRLMAVLFTVVPLAMTFIILYVGAWHQEWPRSKRIFLAGVSSCLIFGVDVLAAVLLVAAACLVAGLARSVGGN